MRAMSGAPSRAQRQLCAYSASSETPARASVAAICSGVSRSLS